MEKDLEFPCEKTTLYETYNPFHVDKHLSPPPTKGCEFNYYFNADIFVINGLLVSLISSGIESGISNFMP